MKTTTAKTLPEWETQHRAATALSIPSPVKVGRYTVQSAPVSDDIRTLYAKDGGGVANYRATWARKNGKPGECTVELYYQLACYPMPVAFGRNGCEGGELRFESGWRPAAPGKRECVVEMTDFDGDYCLPGSVCAVLRALGFTVSDDCLAEPI